MKSLVYFLNKLLPIALLAGAMTTLFSCSTSPKDRAEMSKDKALAGTVWEAVMEEPGVDENGEAPMFTFRLEFRNETEGEFSVTFSMHPDRPELMPFEYKYEEALQGYKLTAKGSEGAGLVGIAKVNWEQSTLMFYTDEQMSQDGAQEFHLVK